MLFTLMAGRDVHTKCYWETVVYGILRSGFNWLGIRTGGGLL
jgi:hypothetical protein